MKDQVINVIKNLKENDSYIFCVNGEDGSIIFESGDSREVFSKLVEREALFETAQTNIADGVMSHTKDDTYSTWLKEQLACFQKDVLIKRL